MSSLLEFFKKLQIAPKSLLKRMFLGALIGVIIISFFIFSVNEPDPNWGKYWIVRPLIIVPFVSAFGILSFYLKNILHFKNRWKILITIAISSLFFLIALWLGIILGLDGTLWN